jgi:tRNA (mo5U34)-methyltransferase
MEKLTEQFTGNAFAPHSAVLIKLAREIEDQLSGDGCKAGTFRKLLQDLPAAVPTRVDLDGKYVRIGVADTLTDESKRQLAVVLKGLHPWRKGPFDVFGTRIDCEWRSDLKWDRLRDRIKPLGNRKVLDIGSSNGYYLFRMAPAAPRLALGLEPYLTFYYQFCALQQYLHLPHVHCLPIRFGDFPVLADFFDTVFCMGILYHSRAPLDMLVRIRQYLAREGELVLETLVIEDKDDRVLCPYPRYAKMHNAYFLPSISCLTGWLRRAGFTDIRCVDVTRTTPAEQRKTDWMTFESLTDFLDPEDPTRTIEGYPAPVRAILLARPK